MSTSQQAPTLPRAGIDVDDPIATAAELRDRFRVGAAERDLERQFLYEQCAAFRASGLLGLMVPREFGGYGGTFSELMRVVILISAGDSNIGQMYQLHTGGIRLLEELASPEVQARWLPRFASGELWITNAYSEVGTPSVNDFNTTVTKVEGGWRLNGTKFYCTGSLAGDITGVFVGIAQNALDDAVDFVGTRARVWYESEASRASEDLYTKLRVGEMKTAVLAAELLALRATELCDDAVAHPYN